MKHVVKTVDGRPLKLAYRDIQGVHEIMREVVDWDNYSLGALRDSGYDVKTCVDVGGHMGFFSAMLRHYWPKARVVCVEPDIDLLPCLKENVVEGICCPVAIRYDGKTEFLVSSYTGGSMVYDPKVNLCDPANYRSRIVETKTFEVVDDWLNGEPIDLMKIDCEGSEFDILPHMDVKLRQRIRRMVGEYHHPTGWGPMEEILKTYYPSLTPKLLHPNPSEPIAMFEAV